MLPLGSIIAKHHLSFHLYADDVQVYLPVLPNTASALESLHSCLSDIKKWLAQNFLLLNENKSEFVLFGSGDVPQIQSRVMGPVRDAVMNLGVVFDRELNFKQQMLW